MVEMDLEVRVGNGGPSDDQPGLLGFVEFGLQRVARLACSVEPAATQSPPMAVLGRQLNVEVPRSVIAPSQKRTSGVELSARQRVAAPAAFVRRAQFFDRRSRRQRLASK
jgi:hypothetical protein